MKGLVYSACLCGDLRLDACAGENLSWMPRLVRGLGLHARLWEIRAHHVTGHVRFAFCSFAVAGLLQELTFTTSRGLTSMEELRSHDLLQYAEYNLMRVSAL